MYVRSVFRAVGHATIIIFAKHVAGRIILIHPISAYLAVMVVVIVKVLVVQTAKYARIHII